MLSMGDTKGNYHVEALVYAVSSISKACQMRRCFNTRKSKKVNDYILNRVEEAEKNKTNIPSFVLFGYSTLISTNVDAHYIGVRNGQFIKDTYMKTSPINKGLFYIIIVIITR
jgi:hypothetical protein